MNNDKIGEDPLDEIRRVRDEHAKKFNYDIDAIIEDIQRFGKNKSLKTVTLPPKRIDESKKTGQRNSKKTGSS